MLTKLYNDNPNPREVRQIASRLEAGETIILPTDTLYAFACAMNQKRAVDAIAQLKGYKLKQAKYSLLCSSLSQVAEMVRPMDKELFTLLRDCLPGPYTFIMEASSQVPRFVQNANHTVGVRVPQSGIVRAIVDELGTPLVCTSVRPLDEDDEVENYTDPELIHERFGSRVSLVVDGGVAEAEPSTVVDCTDGIALVRQGKGEIAL